MRPLLRSLCNKRKQKVINVSIYIEEATSRLGSSVLYYEALNKGFWATQKSQEKVLEALTL